jgi:hypothetical protein
MDRHLMLQHLARAEAHVREGERHIAEQQSRIDALERDGHSAAAAQARELMRTLLDSQTLHVANRDRMRRELDAAS